MRIKTTTLNRLSSSLIVIALMIICVRPSGVQGGSGNFAAKEVYSGNMIYFDGTFGPGAGIRRGVRSGSGVEFFTLTIDSYTPENEVKRMLGALKDGGQDNLMKVLGHEKKGTLQIGTRLGRDIRAVWV